MSVDPSNQDQQELPGDIDTDNEVEIDIDTGEPVPPKPKKKKSHSKSARSQSVKVIQFSCPPTLSNNNNSLLNDDDNSILCNSNTESHTNSNNNSNNNIHYTRQMSEMPKRPSTAMSYPTQALDDDSLEPVPRRQIRESPNRYSKFKRFIKSFSKADSRLSLYKAPPAPDDGRKTLVLDMDETLVHCSSFPPHPSVKYFVLSNNEYLYTRPGLEDFLEYAQQNFEVFIYTFAERDYAEEVLNTIAPNIDEDHRLYRDSCIVKKNLIIKDLDMLNRSKSKLIFVDDNDKALKVNKENTIVIPMWKGVPTDNALLTWLKPILEMCKSASDTRHVIKSIKDKTRRYANV